MKSLAAIGALLAIAAVGPAASAHRLSAQAGGVTCYDGIPCDATHIDGNFEIGVPGVDINYFYIHTSVDSDSGHMSIASAFSWLESTRPGNTNHLADVIEENVELQRVNPGPVTVRATLVLGGGGHFLGDGAVKLNGSVSFGCQVYAEKVFTETISTDLDPIENCDEGGLVGSALVSQATFEGNLPTSMLLRAQLQADYAAVYLGSVVDFQWEGDLTVELFNATATWDSPTFLTEVPEPGAGALALVCFAVLGVRARRLGSLSAKATTRDTPRRGRAPTRPARSLRR